MVTPSPPLSHPIMTDDIQKVPVCKGFAEFVCRTRCSRVHYDSSGLGVSMGVTDKPVKRRYPQHALARHDDSIPETPRQSL